MGCNSTKQADIIEDRKRITREHETKLAPQLPERSAPRGIERPILERKEPDMTGKTYGSSYTEKHLLERDFLLENVLQQDQNKFIDVLSQLSQIDEKEAVERVQKYAKIKFDATELSSGELPLPFKSSNYNVAKILSEGSSSQTVESKFEPLLESLKVTRAESDEKESITVSW